MASLLGRAGGQQGHGEESSEYVHAHSGPLMIELQSANRSSAEPSLAESDLNGLDREGICG
jgi:hypothetical protein